MFLRHYVEVALPAAALAEVLVQDPTRWMPALAGHADRHGRRLMVEVGFPVDRHRAGKRVELELGQPVRTRARTWLPLYWRATGARGLFPALEGRTAPRRPRAPCRAWPRAYSARRRTR